MKSNADTFLKKMKYGKILLSKPPKMETTPLLKTSLSKSKYLFPLFNAPSPDKKPALDLTKIGSYRVLKEASHRWSCG